jgi:hypothetical protein
MVDINGVEANIGQKVTVAILARNAAYLRVGAIRDFYHDTKRWPHTGVAIYIPEINRTIYRAEKHFGILKESV